jgi:hypothetical protein
MTPTIPEEILEAILNHANNIRETAFDPGDHEEDDSPAVFSTRLVSIARMDEPDPGQFYRIETVSHTIISASLCSHAIRRITLPLVYESMVVKTKYQLDSINLNEVVEHLRAELQNVPDLNLVQYVSSRY